MQSSEQFQIIQIGQENNQFNKEQFIYSKNKSIEVNKQIKIYYNKNISDYPQLKNKQSYSNKSLQSQNQQISDQLNHKQNIKITKISIQNNQIQNNNFSSLNTQSQLKQNQLRFSQLNEEQQNNQDQFGEQIQIQQSNIRVNSQQKSYKDKLPINQSRFSYSKNQFENVNHLNNEDKKHISIEQSVYMKKIDCQFKPNVMQNSQSVKINKIDQKYFLTFKEINLEINSKNIDSIAKYFYNVNILLPFFSKKFLKTQENQSNYLQIKDKYIHKYTQFLKQKYKKELIMALESIKSGSCGQSDKLSNKNSYFKFFGLEFLSGKKYSKMKILRKSHQVKLKFWQKAYSMANQKDRKSIKISLDEILDKLRFQKAECYCQKEQNKILENDYWKKLLKTLISDRNWWINQHFNKMFI